VSFFDPNVTPDVEPLSIIGRASTLTDLFAAADHVMLAVPLTAETLQLVSVAELDAFKSGRTLVNVSRGAVIDEDAVARALLDGRLQAFAADVVHREPPDPDDPLVAVLRGATPVDPSAVILTPHVAGTSIESRSMLRQSVAAYISEFAGEALPAQENGTHRDADH
jgi:phosphoglycerate dehydrogenase-like enzyme